jgi:hypothetical protein
VVKGGPGLTWKAVDMALKIGNRGLPGGSSLARLLAAKRGARHKHESLRLTESTIAAWATAHRKRNGDWPNENSGPITGIPDETWSGVNAALAVGLRGLPGGDSLGKLLARRFGIRNKTNIPRLTKKMIIRWARDHRRRTGRWPSAHCGAVFGVSDETWSRIDDALRLGHRGLPGGESLARVLQKLTV